MRADVLRLFFLAFKVTINLAKICAVTSEAARTIFDRSPSSLLVFRNRENVFISLFFCAVVLNH